MTYYIYLLLTNYNITIKKQNTRVGFNFDLHSLFAPTHIRQGEARDDARCDVRTFSIYVIKEHYLLEYGYTILLRF